MAKLVALLDQMLRGTAFQTSERTIYSVEEFREEFDRASGSTSRTLELLSGSFTVSNVTPLVEHLRCVLSEFIDADTGRIGHSFHVVGDVSRRTTLTSQLGEKMNRYSSMSDFAKGLIHAAAVLGSNRVAELIELWAGGKPREYKILVVLTGVHIDDSIELAQGPRMCRLPTSSDLLPVSIPDTNMRSDALANMLGLTLLEIDAATHPAFFMPLNRGDVETPMHTQTVLGECSPDTFFLALSLLCGQRVGLGWAWSDYGEAGFFTRGMRSGLLGSGQVSSIRTGGWSVTSTGVVELASFAPPASNLDEQGLRRAWELRNELQSRLDSDQRFQLAVTRWAKAATPGVINPDRVIDLRIALEALYLDSTEGELGFRLSLTGARHLRTDLDDRKAVRKSLADFYRLASGVIHGSHIGRSADVTMVDTATDLCREGILKLVEQRHKPNWTDILLG